MDDEKRNPSLDEQHEDRNSGDSVSLARRRFLAAASATTLGIGLAGAAAWSAWRFLAPADVGDAGEKVVIPRSRVGVGQAHFFHYRGRPAVVLQAEPGSFIALSAVCTHLGCVVSWRAQEAIFFCPCHAGRFSRTGQVLGGPPPAPLPSYPVMTTADQIVIG